MSNMRSITYMPDMYNLHTRIALFSDHEKLVKQVDGS